MQSHHHVSAGPESIPLSGRDERHRVQVYTSRCQVISTTETVCHLHDLYDRTVGAFREELDAPQVFWRDDPGLHLQTAAVCVVFPADWRHTCQQERP